MKAIKGITMTTISGRVVPTSTQTIPPISTQLPKTNKQQGLGKAVILGSVGIGMFGLSSAIVKIIQSQKSSFEPTMLRSNLLMVAGGIFGLIIGAAIIEEGR